MQAMNTFELNRQSADLRAAMHDMPYGDPFSGSPYGQYHKSKGLGMVLGVVASVVTMGAALPMLSSPLLATQIAGGVMMAGGVMSGVGAITGNKKLSKMGGILSLAGGVGAFASNATGGLGMGSGSEAVQNMAGNMMDSINSTGINVYNPDMVKGAMEAGKAAAEPVAGALSDVQVAQASPVNMDSGVQQTPLADTATTPGLDSNQRGLLNAAGNTPDGTIGIAEAPPNLNAGAKAVVPADAGSTGFAGRSTVTDPAAYTPPAKPSGGILDSSLGFVKENPELSKIGAQALSSFGSAAMAPDQQAYMDAIAAKYGVDTANAKIQGEILQYQADNMKKQVAMLSANDPDIEKKKADYAAKGIPVEIIPVFGPGGVAPAGNSAWGQGVNRSAQTPTRPAPVYGQPAGVA